MTGRKRRGSELVGDQLEPGESMIVQLNGVVAGFTRWSGLGGIVGIVVALSVPRLLDLPFMLGMLSIVVVLGLVFTTIYFVVGRPLAQRNDPPLNSPYLVLVLTDRRVLLLDRALGADLPDLVESTNTQDVSTIRYGKAGPLVPQRLGFVINGTERREFEFPRSEPVKTFVDNFAG
ncbi:MAG: hypothetical protein U9N84_11055 [Actinomycetota bacterium]|nr:hypothetical protein [Actinomycetota bacterium]